MLYLWSNRPHSLKGKDKFCISLLLQEYQRATLKAWVWYEIHWIENFKPIDKLFSLPHNGSNKETMARQVREAVPTHVSDYRDVNIVLSAGPLWSYSGHGVGHNTSQREDRARRALQTIMITCAWESHSWLFCSCLFFDKDRTIVTQQKSNMSSRSFFL